MSSAHPTVELTRSDGGIVRYRQDGMGARPVNAPVDLLYDPRRARRHGGGPRVLDTVVAGGWTGAAGTGIYWLATDRRADRAVRGAAVAPLSHALTPALSP